MFTTNKNISVGNQVQRTFVEINGKEKKTTVVNTNKKIPIQQNAQKFTVYRIEEKKPDMFKTNKSIPIKQEVQKIYVQRKEGERKPNIVITKKTISIEQSVPKIVVQGKEENKQNAIKVNKINSVQQQVRRLPIHKNEEKQSNVIITKKTIPIEQHVRRLSIHKKEEKKQNAIKVNKNISVQQQVRRLSIHKNEEKQPNVIITKKTIPFEQGVRRLSIHKKEEKKQKAIKVNKINSVQQQVRRLSIHKNEEKQSNVIITKKTIPTEQHVRRLSIHKKEEKKQNAIKVNKSISVQQQVRRLSVHKNEEEKKPHLIKTNKTIPIQQIVKKISGQTIGEENVLNIKLPMFEALRIYFKKKKPSFADGDGTKRKVTEGMMKNPPQVKTTAFGQFVDQSGETISSLSQVLLNEKGKMDSQTLAIIGGSGTGKSTLASIAEKFYLDRGKWVFPLQVRDIANDGILITFTDFLATYALMDAPFGKDDDVEDLLRENEENCVFIMHGLDKFNFEPFPLSAVEPLREKKTTASSWFSYLFDKKKMENSKVVFTSRDSVVLQLNDPHRPDHIFRMQGLTENGMKAAMMCAEDDDDINPDEVIAFIKSKGRAFTSLSASPLILGIVATLYKVEGREVLDGLTLVELYRKVVGQLHDSRHVDVKGVELKIQRFCFDLTREGTRSFPAERLNEYELTFEELECGIMVTAGSRKRHHITREDVWITPTHRSLQEYYAAEFVMNGLDMNEYKHCVSEMLFSPNWNMVRRFVTGHTAALDDNHEMRIFFLAKLVQQLEKSLKSTLFGNVFGRKKFDAEVLQSNLLMDLLQTPVDELEFIIEYFENMSKLSLEAQISDVTTLAGTNHFLQEFDPDLKLIDITLPNDATARDFYRFATSIEDLTRKVEWAFIKNISVDGNVTSLLRNVGTCLYLEFSNKISKDNFRIIKTKIQTAYDKTEHSPAFVRLRHNHRDYLLRHQPDMMPYQRKSPIFSKYTSIDLRSRTSLKDLENSDSGLRKFWFDFTLCERREITTLCKLLKSNELNIGLLLLYLPEQLPTSQLATFCNQISFSGQQIQYVHIMNICRPDQFEEICKIMNHVRHLRLSISAEVDAFEKEKLFRRLPTPLPASFKITFPDSEFSIRCAEDLKG